VARRSHLSSTHPASTEACGSLRPVGTSVAYDEPIATLVVRSARQLSRLSAARTNTAVSTTISE
jgi:hypothetical protein